MLSIGAIIAAATQVFIPRAIINTVGNDIILSVIAMIGLSFVVSICSSIDAFFALAYARSFTAGSILYFYLAGPMIDIKLIVLMRTTFRWRFIAVVMLIIRALSFAAGIGETCFMRASLAKSSGGIAACGYVLLLAYRGQLGFYIHTRYHLFAAILSTIGIAFLIIDIVLQLKREH